MDTKLPWYFMWSEDYRVFYELMKDRMVDSMIELRPIEIPQSRFDSELYQYPNDTKKHFWHGSFIKVDCVIESLEKSLAANEKYIVFSDVDVVVGTGLHEKLKPYMEDGNDMVYLREDRHINIGLMLLKVEPSLKFWRAVKEAMVENLELDQVYVNRMLVDYEGKWTHFNKSHFFCTNEDTGNDSWVFIQLLCSCISKEFNMAEKIFYLAQYIHNLNDYMKWVKPDIIPYIYRFQEVLLRQRGQAVLGENQPTLTN